MPPRPNDLCPRPERYSAYSVKATEYEVIELVRGLIRALQPDYVIETGSYKGLMSKAIGEALQQNGHGQLDTVELDPELAQSAAATCEGLPVTVHTGDSLSFTPRKTVDFVWFDSALKLREPEFRRYRSHFARHTLVGFHDTGTRFKLRPRLEQLEAEGLLKAIYLPTLRGLALATVS